MDWPKKPKGMDDSDWHRQAENNLKIAVISADPEPGVCSDCGAKRTRFQCQSYPSRKIVALCKECAMRAAGSPEGLWVRSEKPLRDKWTRDGKDPALQQRMQERRLRAPNRGRRGPGPKPQDCIPLPR